MKKINLINQMAAPSGAAKRFLRGFVLLTALLMLLSTVVFAAWDGQGSTGNENTTTVTGDFSLPYGNEKDIVGYRFSIINGDGKKLGYSADIYRKDPVFDTYYRIPSAERASHVELYKKRFEELSIYVGTPRLAIENDYVYKDTSLPATPTEVEGWLTQDKAKDIAANYCLAEDYNYETDFVIVEPIIMATLEGDHYAMTMAEYAFYQSRLYGWYGLGEADSGVEGTYRTVLLRALSGYVGRYLYAIRQWDALGTWPVPPTAVQDDARGTPSVLLGDSTRYNTAADIVKYQVGMAVYTNEDTNPPSNTHTLTVEPMNHHYLVLDEKSGPDLPQWYGAEINECLGSGDPRHIFQYPHPVLPRKNSQAGSHRAGILHGSSCLGIRS